MVSRSCGGDIGKSANHLRLSAMDIEAALNYAAAFPNEIEAALNDKAKSFEELKRILPNPALSVQGRRASDRRWRRGQGGARGGRGW
jgi:hypothetical protein